MTLVVEDNSWPVAEAAATPFAGKEVQKNIQPQQHSQQDCTWTAAAQAEAQSACSLRSHRRIHPTLVAAEYMDLSFLGHTVDGRCRKFACQPKQRKLLLRLLRQKIVKTVCDEQEGGGQILGMKVSAHYPSQLCQRPQRQEAVRRRRFVAVAHTSRTCGLCRTRTGLVACLALSARLGPDVQAQAHSLKIVAAAWVDRLFVRQEASALCCWRAYGCSSSSSIQPESDWHFPCSCRRSPAQSVRNSRDS